MTKVRFNQINDGEYSLEVCHVQEYSVIFSYLDLSWSISVVGVNSSHPTTPIWANKSQGLLYGILKLALMFIVADTTQSTDIQQILLFIIPSNRNNYFIEKTKAQKQTRPLFTYLWRITVINDSDRLTCLSLTRKKPNEICHFFSFWYRYYYKGRMVLT